MSAAQTVILKLTAAVVVDGKILRAGTKVEMIEFEAKQLLSLGKATLDTTQTPTALRTDGPTVAEYVAAGYLAENYPPQGYASRSTAEEIKDATAGQQAAAAQAAAEAKPVAPVVPAPAAAPAAPAAPAAEKA